MKKGNEKQRNGSDEAVYKYREKKKVQSVKSVRVRSKKTNLGTGPAPGRRTSSCQMMTDPLDARRKPGGCVNAERAVDKRVCRGRWRLVNCQDLMMSWVTSNHVVILLRFRSRRRQVDITASSRHGRRGGPTQSSFFPQISPHHDHAT